MSLQCLKKKVRDEVDFLHADNRQSVLHVDFKILDTNVSYKVILSLLTSMLKHSQSNEINKFANLKKEVWNGVHYLHEDKYQSF